MIWQSLTSLNYSQALDNTNNDKYVLSLFNDHKTTTVFVEIDNSATQVMQEFCSLELNPDENEYEFRARKRDAYRKLSPYIINVPEKYLKTENNLYILNKDMLRTMYDGDTGFKRMSKQEDFIL